MMVRKWFQLVGKDGKAPTSVDAVVVDIEDVDKLRDAVKEKYKDNHLAGIAASDLKVFANGVALEEDSPIGSYGGSKKDALIVQVLSRKSGGVIVSAVSLERSVQKFNARIEYSKLEHQGGVPSTYTTYRTGTVKAFASLLDRLPLIFIRAPPMSGKTAMCNLLYNHIVDSKPNTLVARVCATLMPDTKNFCEYFKSIYGCDFQAFSALKGDRVVFIDEAQVTYDDELLWLGYLKVTLDGGFPGMRFVLFSSYGSFDIYRKRNRAGTPIVIPPANTIGLNATQMNPGLYLSRVELEEMVESNMNGKIVSDLIWILCSGHIGIARAILLFVQTRFGTIPQDAEHIEMELRSERLLQNIRSDYRGIPTADAFERVIRAHDLLEEAKQKMIEVMNGVASGKPTFSSDGNLTRRSCIAVELLTKFGFLYEDLTIAERNNSVHHTHELKFASSMHFKIWLYSNRTDPNKYMISDISHDDFVVACVQRMSASRLQHFACGNTKSIARELQIQMELYGATVSCLTRDVLVTPEWRTNDGKGFIDLVIRGSSILWFWELLVNGDDAVGHSKRFETGGKYHGSLNGSSRYVLIDFRQNKGVRHQKLGFLYVSFVDSFTKARIFGLGKPAVDVELSV